MTIDTMTAQLILDAIAWCNDKWLQALDDRPEWSVHEKVAVARNDFICFCNERKIKEIMEVNV